ncbi:hypothetical protein B0T18DRAFT_431030 [Schizothecium vesticola]|uniref:Uncharacterized protein n=1 Tax=Schizothecium vesticola TaxID=314040 RepID=A0AA40EQW7_9PEZI|nr:hypothetical protein B0T18DRAFT_431030 [Schizothecium vesticola]
MDCRSRSHRSRYDDDYHSYSKPRDHSLGHKAMVKLEDAMQSLTLDRGTNALEVIPYHAGRYHARPPSHHGHHTRSPSRHRHHDHHSRRYHGSSPARPPAPPPPPPTPQQQQQQQHRSRSHWGRGLQASMGAAAIEAFRLRNEPGGWTGAKGGRVAMAALSAGAIGVAAEQRRERREGDDLGKKGTLGAVVAGVAVNRFANGPRQDGR